MRKIIMVIPCLLALQVLTGQVAASSVFVKRAASLQMVLDKTVDNKKVFGTAFAIKKDSHIWQSYSGNFSNEQAYFIASTTKLFTTTIILKLQEKGLLQLEDTIGAYLNKAIVDNLHIFKGKEYSYKITIKHLLAHTSGLPDYFQGKSANGKSLQTEITSGTEKQWTFEEAIAWTKEMKPLFAPGTKNKAHYSDANFQLLGKIIENITKKSYAQNCQDLIVTPLGLQNTYIYANHTDTLPKTLYYKEKELHVPKAMASFGADGGIVSTNTDMLIFIEAFFTGKLFAQSTIGELQKWNKIFFPMRAGVGIHLFKLPKMFNPTGVVPYYIGHSGLSGAVAFYSPSKNMYIVGTVNQVAHPDISFKTMIKLSQIVLK